MPRRTRRARELTENWRALRMVLEDARAELTRQQILEQWPTTFPCPKPTTLWYWLTEAEKRGLIRCEGSGRRSEPFRYYLPEQMEKWKDDPIYRIHEMARQSMKQLAERGFDVEAH